MVDIEEKQHQHVSYRETIQTTKSPCRRRNQTRAFHRNEVIMQQNNLANQQGLVKKLIRSQNKKLFKKRLIEDAKTLTAFSILVSIAVFLGVNF